MCLFLSRRKCWTRWESRYAPCPNIPTRRNPEIWHLYSLGQRREHRQNNKLQSSREPAWTYWADPTNNHVHGPEPIQEYPTLVERGAGQIVKFLDRHDYRTSWKHSWCQVQPKGTTARSGIRTYLTASFSRSLSPVSDKFTTLLDAAPPPQTVTMSRLLLFPSSMPTTRICRNSSTSSTLQHTDSTIHLCP